MLEYAEHGDLSAFLRRSAKAFTETAVRREIAGILDVLHAQVNKAEALAYLQGLWGVAASETLAIGDNWNDHEMLCQAGLGLVMGNADPAMLELGLPVLPTNDQDGVAHAIERYVLGGAAS